MSRSDHVTYETAVRSFAHEDLALLPAYHRLRQALSDLANEAAEGELAPLASFLEAVRDMALTAPYGDTCRECSRAGHDLQIFWPHSVIRTGGFIRGTYRCSNGHTWTCGYAVDVMRYL